LAVRASSSDKTSGIKSATKSFIAAEVTQCLPKHKGEWRKILKFLNTDPDYSKKIRETTVKKYNIQQVNGQYISVK
jgi:hypothetical protein